jgi:hypothetical protein
LYFLWVLWRSYLSSSIEMTTAGLWPSQKSCLGARAAESETRWH